MKKSFVILLFLFISFLSNGEEAQNNAVQNQEIRIFCKKGQELEHQISKLEHELNEINKREKSSIPVIRSIYEILTRCFTTLFDIQRFSPLLAMNYIENKNDFVRCSIIIKAFSTYFRNVSTQLEENSSEIIKLKKRKIEISNELEIRKKEYQKIKSDIIQKISDIARNNDETIIQNIVCHIAAKSTSIDELDAELESENAVGVLKNTKVATELSLAYPVNGRIVAEFGDKGKDNAMIYYIAFEARSGALVTSPVKGQVVFSGRFLNYDNMVIISNGEYRVFLYGMDSIFPTAGDVVEIGDYIGRMKDNQLGKQIIKMELRKSGESLDPRHWLFQTLEKEGK